MLKAIREKRLQSNGREKENNLECATQLKLLPSGVKRENAVSCRMPCESLDFRRDV